LAAIDDSTGLGINYAGFVIHGCMHSAARDPLRDHTHWQAGGVSAEMRLL
jgi:hypothetical protein